MSTDQAGIIREVLAPIHRAVPVLAAAWDDSGWRPSRATELHRMADMLRPAVVALAGLVADLSGDEGPGLACHSCCGAGTVACLRCAGSGAERLPETA